MDAPQIVEIPLTLTRRHDVRENRALLFREKGTADDIHQQRARFNAGVKKNGIGPEFALWVDWVEIERIRTRANRWRLVSQRWGFRLMTKASRPRTRN